MRKGMVVLVTVLGAGLGFGLGAGWSHRDPSLANAPPQNTGKPARKIKYYWDPMLGPSSISNHPGKSAMNMDLTPVYENEQASPAHASTGGPEVDIDASVVQNMGVTTAPVVHGPLHVTIRTVGILKVPEPALHDVTLKINGYVEHLYANFEGMTVRKGQVLFDLYSPDLQVAEQELIAAQENLHASAPENGTGVSAEAASLVDSATQKLRLWDIAEQDINAIAEAKSPPRTVPIRSPANGHVMDKMVVEGSAIQAGTRVMRIESHAQLWLDAQVYEAQTPAVKIGQDVRVTVDGAPGKTFTGKIVFIWPHVDPVSRTEAVRVVLDNAFHKLSPGMFATAEIVTEGPSDAVLAPREAVIDTGTRQIAFVADPVAPGHFQPRLVRMGVAGDDDQVQILEGLTPGDQVVTSGQFLMDVESRTTEAIEKLQADRKVASSEPPHEVSPGASASLALAHCSMRNADWIQQGSTIVNPYLGASMTTCGQVVRQLTAPRPGSKIDQALQAYLKVAAGLGHDKVDSAALADLKQATAGTDGKVPPALRSAVATLALARNLDHARTAFERVSAAIAPSLESVGNP